MKRDPLRAGLEACLKLLRGEWRGTGLGFYRTRAPMSFAATLYGGVFEFTIGGESLDPGDRRVLRERGYAEGRLGFRRNADRAASIEVEWEDLLRVGRPRRVRRPRRLSAGGVDRAFAGLVRWYRGVRSTEWSVGGAEFALAREESSHGYRWATRRDIMLDRQGLHAAFFAWPREPFRAPDRKRLEGFGFYRRMDNALGDLGLIGRWGPMSAARPNELSADHWRRRIAPGDLPRLWKALTALRLPSHRDS